MWHILQQCQTMKQKSALKLLYYNFDGIHIGKLWIHSVYNNILICLSYWRFMLYINSRTFCYQSFCSAELRLNYTVIPLCTLQLKIYFVKYHCSSLLKFQWIWEGLKRLHIKYNFRPQQTKWVTCWWFPGRIC